MKKKNLLTQKDKIIFENYFSGTKKIEQDKVFHYKIFCKRKINLKKYFISVDSHIFYFSDFKSKNVLFKNNSVFYIKNDSYISEFKKLKNGYYTPEIFLDLHGFTQIQAKRELGYLMQFCEFNKINCVNIIYGIGKNILKNQVPIWLSKHPNIIAFKKAPKIFGNNGALLVLIEF